MTTIKIDGNLEELRALAGGLAKADGLVAAHCHGDLAPVRAVRDVQLAVQRRISKLEAKLPVPMSKAYNAGLADGLAWDLSGYESLDAVRRDRESWDEATLSAIGPAAFCALVGLPVNAAADKFGIACSEYNRGAHAGACTSQENRTGLPAGGK